MEDALESLELATMVFARLAVLAFVIKTYTLYQEGVFCFKETIIPLMALGVIGILLTEL